MEAPSPSYILSRAAFFIILVVVVLFGYGFVKKKQRQSEIITELESITSDSSFFKQFYAADARKALIRAIGLIAEANSLGTPPDEVIDRGMGIKPKFFENDAEFDEPPPRERVIRNCLRANYENFNKLGYIADFQTLDTMKNGELPAIPSGPESGRKPVIVTLISPTISPGMENVIANLEIRPPQADGRKPTDIEIAAAKQLAHNLAYAGIIEDRVSKRIVAELSATVKP